MNEYNYLSPEKVYLKLNLAGVGARFVACYIDTIIQVLLASLLFVALVSINLHDSFSGWLVAILIIGVFVIFNGYYIFFETIWNGQTPGKRFAKLRVVQQNGSSTTFIMILIRNLLKTIDFLPFFFVIGIITIFVSKKNQRLGDLAAGTVVIRELREVVPETLSIESIEVPWANTTILHSRKISEADFAVLKKYLLRRRTMKYEEALILDQKLANYFSEKLGVNQKEIKVPSQFLKQVATIASQGAAASITPTEML